MLTDSRGAKLHRKRLMFGIWPHRPSEEKMSEWINIQERRPENEQVVDIKTQDGLIVQSIYHETPDGFGAFADPTGWKWWLSLSSNYATVSAVSEITKKTKVVAWRKRG
jgi:hypothetical protein